MATIPFDERDIMFNCFECPGMESLTRVVDSEDCHEDTLRMLVEQSLLFADRVLVPLNEVADRQGCTLTEGRVTMPDDHSKAWEQYKELGIMAICASEAFGGAELPHFFAVAPAELECSSCVAFSTLPLLSKGAANLIATFGSDALKAMFLENMYSGHWSGTMCLTEPQAGSDVGACKTKAEGEGDVFLISGTKSFISWGEHELAENIVHLVLARMPDGPPGTKGLGLFAVPKFWVDESGMQGPNDVTCVGIEHKMGFHGSPTCVLDFGSEGQCRGYLVGAPYKGIEQMFQLMNAARFEVGVQGMGVASSAYMYALGYAQERKQGTQKTPDGYQQVPLIYHPDVQRMLLTMRALVHGSRSLLYHVALFQDLANHDESRSAFYSGLVDLLIPVSKSFGSDQGFNVISQAIQVLGGYGYCADYPVEQFLRDVRITSIWEGTNGIQALDLVFRKILGSKGKYLEYWHEWATSTLEDAEAPGISQDLKAVKQAHQMAMATSKHLGQMAMEKQIPAIQFVATPFQEAFGHVVVATMLAKQAGVACRALTRNDLSQLDREFYEDKLTSLNLFCQHLLPKAEATLRTLSTQSDAFPSLRQK